MKKLYVAAPILLILLAIVAAVVFFRPAVSPEKETKKPEKPATNITAMFRGNLERTGIYEGQALKSTPEVKWKAEIEKIYSSPTIDKGTLYIGTYNPHGESFLYAYDAETGEEQWKFKTEGKISSSAAVDERIEYIEDNEVFERTVYIGDDKGNFYAVNAEDGSLLWDYKAEEGKTSSPAIYNGVVYFGGMGEKNGFIFALDAKSGEEVWKYENTTEQVYGIESTPAIADGTLYFRSGLKFVIALDAKTGVEKWATNIGGMSLPVTPVPSPAVYEGKVFCGSMDKNLYALDAKTGKEAWKFDTGDFTHSSPAFYEDTVFIGGWSNTLFAIDINSGKKVWDFKIDKWIHSSPSVAGDTVYFGSNDGKLYAVEAETGEKIWDFEAGGWVLSSPAVANGVVYIGGEKALYALK